MDATDTSRLADPLRDNFKRLQYGRVILPFTVDIAQVSRPPELVRNRDCSELSHPRAPTTSNR